MGKLKLRSAPRDLSSRLRREVTLFVEERGLEVEDTLDKFYATAYGKDWWVTRAAQMVAQHLRGEHQASATFICGTEGGNFSISLYDLSAYEAEAILAAIQRGRQEYGQADLEKKVPGPTGGLVRFPRRGHK